MKHSNKLTFRRFVFFLALCLALTWPLSAEAIATTDQGNNLVTIASSQVGVVGGTTYRTWFYGKDNTNGWCAIFVSWCANRAGISTNVIPKSAVCGTMYTGLLNRGGIIVSTPQAGDIVFYYDNAYRRYAHVGIMISDTETVQGNLSNPSQVKKLAKATNYSLGSKREDYQNYKVIYVRPNYGASTSISNPTVVTTTKSSVYTNAATNITTTSAQLNASLKINGGTGNISEHGAYLGTSTSNMTLVAKDTVDYKKSSLTMFYNTSKYGTSLEPGTTYYYYCYAVVDGQTVKGDTVSFKTEGKIPPTSVKVTTNDARNITETSAQLNGSLKISGGTGNISEHGAYLGTSTSNMTLVARDTVNYNKNSLTMYYSTSKYGATLEPGTTYYYYCYAVVDGQTVKGDIVSFKTEGEIPPISVKVTTNNASNITETSAQLNGALKISGGTGNISEHGAYLGTSTSNMTLVARDTVNYNKNSLTTYYSTSKYDTTLEPGTTYYYYCYAVVDGQTVKGDTVTFETLGGVPSAYVTTNAASNITETSAQLNGSLKISGGTGNITEHGAYLGTSTSNMTMVARDTVNYNKSSLTTFYSTSKYGTTLEPGTTYYYYCYAVVDGQTFTGSTVSFTTHSETPPPEPSEPEPTWVGYVSGTNGALAINDRPAASPKYSTQVGRIPEGSSCTVYPNKTSGSWYWVEYGGDSGYAYSSYISSTPPTPPEPSGPVNSPPATRIGYISGTNGALAINDRPASSPKNSTQIGRIPEGASCTVYTDKGSGNWYWVEYNGVSGYAYGKYISLQ